MKRRSFLHGLGASLAGAILPSRAFADLATQARMPPAPAPTPTAEVRVGAGGTNVYAGSSLPTTVTALPGSLYVLSSPQPSIWIKTGYGDRDWVVVPDRFRVA